MSSAEKISTLRRKKSITLSGFTLVELIVVITILVILGTIAFISLGGYTASARDGARIENLTNLHKGLSLFQIKSGKYPMPENPVNITASGTIIGYQGFAKDSVGTLANISKGGTIDPTDASMYTTYSVNASQDKMTLMAFLEDGSNLGLISELYADTSSDYSKRYPIMRGDTIGILLGNTGSTLNQPVQETGTGVDVMNTTGNYIMYISKTQKFSGTGASLRAGMMGGGLVGYWNFDEGSGNTAYDSSGNGNNGTLTGSVLPVWGNGKSGKELVFGGNGYVSLGDKPAFRLKNTMSISLFIKTNATTGFSNLSIIGKYGVANPGDLWYNLNLNQNGLINCGALGCAGAGVGYNVADNAYHHIIITDAGNIGSMYLDGKKINRGTTSFRANDASTTELRIGSVVRGWTNFSGSIDEVRIYDRALSDSEVQILYDAMK